MANNLNYPIPQVPIGESFVWRDWFQRLSNVAFGTAAGINLPVLITQGGTGSTTASAALGALGASATGTDTTYAYRANNLSDLASLSTARSNLGLGGGVSGTFKSGDLVPKTITVTNGIITSIV